MTGKRRRDLLTTSALALTGIGLATALWPFAAALGPDAETSARQQVFNLGTLRDTEQALLNVAGIPILIFSRTPEQQAKLKASHDQPGNARPPWTKSWHRSLRPDIMVCIARCPHDYCIVGRNETREGSRLICPCCASAFSLAGHRISGPASRDLDLPAYRFISPHEIEIGPLG